MSLVNSPCDCGAPMNHEHAPHDGVVVVCMVCGIIWLGRDEPDGGPGYFHNAIELADGALPRSLRYIDVESLCRALGFWRREAQRSKSALVATYESLESGFGGMFLSATDDDDPLAHVRAILASRGIPRRATAATRTDLQGADPHEQ